MRPLLVFFLIFVASLDAQTSRPGIRRGGNTFFEDKLLDRSTLVVRGVFLREDTVGSVQVTRFTVSAVYVGAPRTSVAVVAVGDVSAVRRDVERVLFLKADGGSQLHTLVEATDLGVGADETETWVRHWIATASASDPVVRRQMRRRGVFEGLRSSSRFVRRLAVREAAALAKTDPDGLHASDAAGLKAASRDLPDTDRDILLAVASALESTIEDPYAGLESTIPEGALRREWANAMTALRTSDDPRRRAAVADAVIEGFSPKSDAFVLRALDDRDGSVRAIARKWAVWRDLTDAAVLLSKRVGRDDIPESEVVEIVDALGWLGDDGVPGLTSALRRGGPVISPVIRALGRIGSPSALNALDGLRKKSTEDPTLLSEGAAALLREAVNADFRTREAGSRPRKPVAAPRR